LKALALLLLATPAFAGVRAGGGFTTGRWDDDGARRVSGGRAFGEWLAAPWRVSLGLRALSARPETGARETELAGAALAGWDRDWIHAALGVGAVGRRVLPAGALRLGDPVFVQASFLDFTPRSPGPGLARVGVGAALAGSRVWAGWAWDAHGGGAGLGVVLPLGDRAGLWVDAAADPRSPGDYVLMEAGFRVSFGGDPEPD
jgi:hypothetical protein